LANGFQLTGALGSNFLSVIVRCILATSTLEGGKTAAKSVMAAVAAHREEFELQRAEPRCHAQRHHQTDRAR